jgi:hypothetical protein
MDEISNLLNETDALIALIDRESDALCAPIFAATHEESEIKIDRAELYVALLGRFKSQIEATPDTQTPELKAAFQALNFALERNAAILKSHFRRTQNLLETIVAAAAPMPMGAAQYTARGTTNIRAAVAPIMVNAQA